MSGMEKWEHLKMPFSDIEDATKDFQKEIGKGGYGLVYEGKLFIDGRYMKVAIKRLNEKFGQGLKEFLTEIDLLWDQKHKNIISLVGYCDEENEKIIVYEYADRGSLDMYLRFINANYTLTWPQRFKIVVDVARGLDHLHNHLPKKQVIIHRDVKSSNILLDDKWIAKISDFGLSKSTSSGLDRSTVVTQACGTPGYVAPELKQFFMANKNADVYSFGMVLFEVLCGRLCRRTYADGIILSAELVQEYYTGNILDNIIDPSLREQMNPHALSKYSAIAYKCLQAQEQRPPMGVVKKELEEILKIQVFHSTPTYSMLGMKSNLLTIPFADIKNATKDFTNVLGRGSNGSMYEGVLSIHGIYTKVAIKRFGKEFGQGRREFLTEIQLLPGQQHENFVTLVGYCDEGTEKIIVYEYAKHGSLDRYITSSNTSYTLTWLERLKIVVDAARGLDHLHNNHQNNDVIIHRDIKSSNILLDDKWIAKITGFGLSKLTVSNASFTYVVTDPCGTDGYVDPAYYEGGVLNRQSDVYSFGVVLCEVLCGKLSRNLGCVAQECFANDQLDRMIDPILKEQMSSDSLIKFSAIAYKCLQDRRVERPQMDVVKKELEETLKIEVLRWKSFFSRHWYILNVGDASSKIDITVQHDETGRLKSLRTSCEANKSDAEDGQKKLPNSQGRLKSTEEDG